MDAAARTAHDSTLQPFSEMEHYKHADELPPEIMADSYDKLERLCLKYMNEDDFSNVEQAYCFAAEKHCNQKRRSGEMYINHPVEVAIILADLKMDCDVVCAALLHDTVEDTETSLADVSGLFGETVAGLVDGVTKLTNIEVDSMDEKQALTLRKMFLAMAKDIRVILIKLADRLHNARTFQFLPERKQRDKALETMEIYAPIAHRLGMSRIKWELEDLSLKVLDPIGYNEIVEGLKAQSEQHEEFLQGIQDRISAAYAEAYEALKKANIMLGSVGGYAAGVPVERGVQMSTRSVMGVELPTLRLNTTSPMGLYYDLESTNGTLDVAYLKFNEVKTLTVELAEVETSVIRLAEAIQKTQKRANALGNVQIPQMQKTIKSINEVLSEREREEFSRLKVIKAQKEKEEA